MTIINTNVISGLIKNSDGSYRWEVMANQNKYRVGDTIITAYKGSFRVTSVSAPYSKHMEDMDYAVQNMIKPSKEKIAVVVRKEGLIEAPVEKEIKGKGIIELGVGGKELDMESGLEYNPAEEEIVYQDPPVDLKEGIEQFIMVMAKKI